MKKENLKKSKMKKLILIFATTIMLFSCCKEEVKPKRNNEKSDFTGAWHGYLCGQLTQVNITQRGSYIIINGTYPCEIINGNGFKSKAKYNYIHTGTLNGDVLNYSESFKGKICSGKFYKD